MFRCAKWVTSVISQECKAYFDLRSLSLIGSEQEEEYWEERISSSQSDGGPGHRGVLRVYYGL